MTNKTAGQPPKFKTVRTLEKEIDKYFKKGVKKKTVIIGKKDNQQVIKIPIPTITGLAIYLGFCSRQSFYDYEKVAKFSYTIKRARLFIECEYEEQLHTGNVAGAIFALKNMGWIDKQEIDTKLTGTLNLSQALDQAEEDAGIIPDEDKR